MSPTVYLLNHRHWTSMLVLNFPHEVAPLDAVGQTPDPSPQLEPHLDGVWRWEDPSRLVFLPANRTFEPDTSLTITLQGVSLRQGYRLDTLRLTYRTPPLKATLETCVWNDIREAPFRRELVALLHFNYPVDNPVFVATLGENHPVPLKSGHGARIVVRSDALVRPAQDGKLRFELKPGVVRLRDRDGAGASANMEKGVECELPVLRADWDKLDEPVDQTPTVKAVRMTLEDEKLAVRLKGKNLIQSAKRASAGEPVKRGIALDPAVEGVWRYGEAADGPDLIFTPADPKALKPGTVYRVTVNAAAFPDLVFAQPSLSSTYKMAEMNSAVDNIQLYSDPTDPKLKRVTATLSFSYPPKRESLAAHTSVRLRLEPAKSFSDRRVRAVPYELVYDEKNPRLVYLKTVPMPVPEEPGEVKITLEKGLLSSLGGEPQRLSVERTLPIPSIRDYFKVTELESQNVIESDGEIKRLLVLRTTTPLKDPESLHQSVEVHLLPDCRERNPDRPALCEARGIQEWQSADQVDPEVIKLSERVPVTGKSSDSEDKTLHYLSFAAPEKRQLLVKVNKGLESVDGFRLAEDARYLIHLGPNQRELKILHDGALLSLSGSKKLGVAARGVHKVRVQLQRVLPHNMHHFAQFTRGDYQNPSFTLPLEHFAETFEYEEILPKTTEMARQYFSVDFARFTRDRGFPPRGLFLLTVTEKTETDGACGSGQNAAAEASGGGETAESQADCGEEGAERETGNPPSDQRLVLITDMGILVKTGGDGRQEVFVMSFRDGLPVAGAQVSLLGRNGIALFAGKTDAQGRVSLPSAEGLKAEKTPAVYLVEKDGDLSFLPFSRDNRLLDVSRFDVDGLRDTADSLHAYLFSDRGIYRPGDTVHIGLILRKRDWSALPAGLPLKAVITDPEEQEVLTKTLAFGAEGLEELTWETPAMAKTGSYRVELFIGDKDRKSLGYTMIRVEEFQPDRLQVKTEIPGAPATGWLNPQAAKAKVSVRNLFGTPAAGNLAKLELTFRPWSGHVPAFPDYRFRGTVVANIPEVPTELGEMTTDAEGVATFDLPLASVAEPVYEIALAGEGFEKGSGRSVIGVASALVSRLPFLLGYAADGQLDYIGKGSQRSLSLLALGPDFQPYGAGQVRAEIYETRYVSTLVKREDGLYAYQSVRRDELRTTENVALTDGKGRLALPTENPGSFFVVFKNESDEELNRVAYTVAGEGNVSRSIERNAELDLRLDKKEYTPGEEIEVQIVAPYQGAGLITIEQDRVLASRWIKTNTTASTHRIALPKGVSGNAYLSVAFVRSMDSPEIYMSPLSHGVVPFAISRSAYTQEMKLSVPETVRSGSGLDVRYSLAEPTKLVLYAVDEGILQFAHYRNPEPLDHFFRKRALQVRTHQILDMILPDYALVQKISAPGGDGDAETFGKYKNPFARKRKPPLAVWSGIIDAAPGEHVWSVPVPEYFNGSVRVLAVAVNAGKIGASAVRTVAHNPYVIQPQQPYVVAPGDEFDLGVLVADTTGKPGDKSLEVSVSAGDALELLSPNPQTLKLSPGRDGTVRFRAKAKEKLGPIEVRYRVAGGGEEAGYSEEMSIRPSQPLLTTLQMGVLRMDEQKAGKTRSLDLTRELYDAERHAELAVSVTPGAYLRGIVEFLKHYPYGCTEQVVSQAFPAVVLGANPELGLSPDDPERLLERSLRILQTRQKYDGSFGFWSAADGGDPFYSLYAAHLMLEARDRGYEVADSMFERAMSFADQYAQTPRYRPEEHEAQSYALYLLARSGRNVAERLRSFDADMQRQWEQGGEPVNRVRFFLGAAYKLHHLDSEADRYFGEVRRAWKKTGSLPWGIQKDPDALSLYLYLVNKHAPESLDSQDPQFGRYLVDLSQDLVKQRVSSFRGSWALLGLGSLWSRFAQADGKALQVSAGRPPAPLALQGSTVKRAVLEPTTRPLEIKGDASWNLYYQLTERGYDKTPPAKPISQGVTINRQLLDAKGEKIRELSLQDKLHIRLALHPDRPMKNLAVVMLIPGGFEIDLSEDGLASRKSLPIEKKPLWEPDYIDVQEDRVVFFGALDGGEKYFEFRLKPLNIGTYAVPPVFAEGMYDTEIQYRGLAGTIRVTE
ncbi:alpha-2-macroglobulin family protein [Methylocaldum szegediense]|nr:alpha-2-macroglobulin [Methylocaldum szegediense]